MAMDVAMAVTNMEPVLLVGKLVWGIQLSSVPSSQLSRRDIQGVLRN